MEDLRKLSNSSELNKIYRRNGKIGIVTSGGAFNYVMDAVEKNDLNVDVFKVTLSHPFPDELLLEFIKDLDAVAVVEEVDPIMEKEVLAILGKNGLDMVVHGKLDQTLP